MAIDLERIKRKVEIFIQKKFCARLYKQSARQILQSTVPGYFCGEIVIMKSRTDIISGWGNYPVIRAEVFESSDRDEIAGHVRTQKHTLARGNGKSYGDAALAPVVFSTLGLNRLLHFDAENGIITCESGVLLADLLPVIIPAGWFFHVTPGLKMITIGGAIASDVHGKNHPAKGCFSNWVLSFELMQADGSVITCSKTENTALFWQTCGGMGWTGIILSASFQLMRLPSMHLRQETRRSNNLETLFRHFTDHTNTEYAAAWVDATAKGAQTGRGAVYFAEHLHDATPLEWAAPRVRQTPFYAPSWLLNKWSIRLHNAYYFNKNKPGEKTVGLDSFFYPLDSIADWNRLYGRRGFVQYQFCLPENRAFDGMRNILTLIGESTETPFLSVLKRHGERPPEAVHSFPVKGYSLALDFPRTGSLQHLIPKLDDMVWRFDGKIYLTKDACSAPKMGRIDPLGFGERKFQSLLRERIGNNA